MLVWISPCLSAALKYIEVYINPRLRPPPSRLLPLVPPVPFRHGRHVPPVRAGSNFEPSAGSVRTGLVGLDRCRRVANMDTQGPRRAQVARERADFGRDDIYSPKGPYAQQIKFFWFSRVDGLYLVPQNRCVPG